MLQKLSADHHSQPFKGPFSITRIHPADLLNAGPLSNIDHATMKKGLTIKMHEHIDDEILSYVWQGTSYHKDSAGFEAPIAPGKLMMMNAGYSFWHEEKVKNESAVEMLQIFVRPREENLDPDIQFHDKPVRHREWYLMAGPEGSDAPLALRQHVYILDAHPAKGDRLDVPVYEGLKPFLYVMNGEIAVEDLKIKRQEAVTDLETPLSSLTANADSTVVLFFVDVDAPMSMAGTISGLGKT
ncbi:pirin family protein [Salicibibacter kimchii]|uniref:Pirin family protein n=1 Tax=Salicibibacter kimchii TaxID=2099786 RepID=A0A345BWJ8_9BACI|nr:pirin family protein [Salicibibacter kimchii]AXF55329.1 hypothetical protein DT065_04355 [Salicibibacter kimchii]